MLGSYIQRNFRRLVNDGILLSLEFTALWLSMDFKGKQIKHNTEGTRKSTQLLEIMHRDICGPFGVPSFGGAKSFIPFIDDFSCYDYVYLLHKNLNQWMLLSCS